MPNTLMKKGYYVIAFFIIFIGYILCQGISIWQYASVDETCKADVAIVLGAAASDNEVSPVFRERINQGIRLYENGYVEKIMITGGYGEENQYSDAYVGMQYAMEQGTWVKLKFLAREVFFYVGYKVVNLF